MQIVLATRNADKIREIAAILQPIDVVLRSVDEFDGAPEVVEDGATLEENALKKAREIREFTGLCALADDTGLEVEALDGAPGVYSSRYDGEDATYESNCRKLLAELEGTPDGRRQARFRCVMALALVSGAAQRVESLGKDREAVTSAGADKEAPDALVTHGLIEGVITREKRGTSGFGYDPVFEVPQLGKTLAELPLEQKNEISHRYRALVEMRELLLRLGLAKERRR